MRLSDPSGYFIEEIIIGIVGGVVCYVAQLIGMYWWNWTKHFSWRDCVYAALTGALWGALGPFFGCLSKILYPLGLALAKVVGYSIASAITGFIAVLVYRHERS